MATDKLLANRKHCAYLFLFLILAVVAAIRIRLLNLPLERDEGEFAYAGQLLLQGISPYKGAYNVMLKLPGTCGAYALIMAVFGQTAAALHGGVLLVDLATALLVFGVARRAWGDAGGVVAAGTYALLSIVPTTLGLAAHATHFVMLPAMAGIYLLQNLDDRTTLARMFFAGLLIGVAVLMKQTGAAFGLFAAVWALRLEISSGQKQWQRLAMRLAWLAGGGLLPFLLTCAAIIAAGDFNRFWFWTFKLAAAHAGIVPFGRGLETMAGVIVALFRGAPGLWCLAGLGAFVLCADASLRRERAFVLSFALFSCAAVWPGWRAHYFIQLLPAAGLLAAAAFRWFSGLLTRYRFSRPLAALPALVFAVAGLSLLVRWNDLYFRLTPAEASRAVYQTNPFPEAVEVGNYLAAHCPPGQRIAVLGSEPEIYFYSRRLAVTGYICTYTLMEPQPYAAAMQTEMIRQIEQGEPEYVVFVHVAASWLQYSDSNPMILKWFGKYQRTHLQLAGLVEIYPDAPTQYHWFDGNVTDVKTDAPDWLAIFRMRPKEADVPHDAAPQSKPN